MTKIAEVQTSWQPDFDSDAANLETDKNLEKKVINALHANAFINCDKIRVRVTGRLVYLEGTVRLQKERISAQKCIRDIFGIRAVINYLTYHNEYAQ
ncbi:BON domain-containing protein [Dyadobacter arcticus]|uniref:Osmotically-inducible protein OsmY n=1 Tax=Dyadobacter arcticus TaxID=1078754 RepID=A0ABX0UI56_9BACT|nr:BON domain-containing protein [Dyadobacter arcticus]NIJ52602.1 osmotically-inducible protein OsmY [Dyadobacter arcticus]